MQEQPDDWYEGLLDKENNPDYDGPRGVAGDIKDEAVGRAKDKVKDAAKDKAKNVGKNLGKQAGKTAAKEGAKAGAEAGASAAAGGGSAAATGAGIAATTGVETAGVGVAVGAAVALLGNKTFRKVLYFVVPLLLIGGVFFVIAILVLAPIVILSAVVSVVGKPVEIIYDVRSTAISAATLGPKLVATGAEKGKDLADSAAGFVEDHSPINIPGLGAVNTPHDPNSPQVLAAQTMSQESRLYKLSLAMNEKGFFKRLKEQYGINVITTEKYQFDIYLDKKKIYHANSVDDALRFFANDKRIQERMMFVMNEEHIYDYGRRVTFAENGMSQYQSARLFIPNADKAESDTELTGVKKDTIDTVNTPFFTQAQDQLECSRDCGDWVPTTVEGDQETVTKEISPSTGFLPKNTLFTLMDTRVIKKSAEDARVIEWFNYVHELQKAADGQSPEFNQGILDTRKSQAGRLWFNWQTQVDQLKAGKLTTKSGNTLFKNLSNIGGSKAFHRLNGLQGGNSFREYEKINENKGNVAKVIYDKWREDNGEDAQAIAVLLDRRGGFWDNILSWIGQGAEDKLLELFHDDAGVRKALRSAFKLGSEAMIPKCDSSKAGSAYFNCLYAGAQTSYRDVGIKDLGTNGKISKEDYQQVLAFAGEVDQKIAAQQPLSDRLFSIDSRSSFARTVLMHAVVPVQTSGSFVEAQSTLVDMIGKLPSIFGSTLSNNTSAAIDEDTALNNIDPAGIRVNTLQHTDLSPTLNQPSGSADTCPQVEGENMCKADETVLLAMQAKYDALEDSSGASFSFIIGTYNQKRALSLAQHNAAVDNIVQAKMDVVGTQETGNPKYARYKTALMRHNYGVFPDYGGAGDSTNCSQNTSIFYDKDKFSFVKGELFKVPRYPDAPASCGGGEQTERTSNAGYADGLPNVWANIPLVWLQDNATGRVIIVINTHNVANVAMSNGTKPSYSRYIASKIYVDQIKRLKEENPDSPIFFTGDFNEGTGVRDSRNVTYQGKYQNLLFCMFSDNGLMKSVVHNMGCPTGGSGVDFIYVEPDIKVDWHKDIPSGGPNSGPPSYTDHPVLYAQVTVPGASFRVASFNIYHSDDAIWRERLRRSVNTLVQNKVDVAGLQEVRPDQMELFNTPAYGGNIYDMYPKALRNPEFTPNPIIWDKSKFTLLEKRSVGFTYFGGMRDKAPVLKFKVNATGQQFWFANTHDPADAQGPAAQLRYENAKAYAVFFKDLAKEGVPIFFVGDFNSGYQVRHGGNDTYQYKRENLTYCILTDNTDLRDSWDAFQEKNGKCPSTSVRFPDNLRPNPTSPIDHIFLSKDVTVTKYFRALRGKQNNGSDVHDTIIAEVGLGKESKSIDRGEVNPGALAWPVARRDWPQRSMPVAECGLSYSSGTVHTGMDISVPTGTTIYAAADATVTYAGGSYGAIIAKTKLTTQDGTPIYINYQHLSRVNVRVNATIKQGDPIGKSGSTGTASPHLHFGVWKTGSFLSGHDPVNSAAGRATLSKMLHPMNYLPDDGRNVSECRKPYVVP